MHALVILFVHLFSLFYFYFALLTLNLSFGLTIYLGDTFNFS